MIMTRLRALAVLVATPGLLFLPTNGLAQSKKPTLSIAVVDVTKLLRDSKGMKGVRDQAEKIQKKFKSDYSDDVKQLKAEEQKLRKDQPAITGQVFEQRRQALTRQYVALRRKSQLQGRLLNAAYQKALGRFREEIVIVVKSLSVEAGYTLVLNQATTIHVAPQFDITDTVLARLNKRLSKIDFKVEGVNAKKPAPKRNNKKK